MSRHSIKCLKCDIVALFEHPNGNREYCTEHRKKGMINLVRLKGKSEDCTQQQKVNSGKELCSECNEIALYGFYSGEAKYCFQHKEPHMINLYSLKCKEI